MEILAEKCSHGLNDLQPPCPDVCLLLSRCKAPGEHLIDLLVDLQSKQDDIKWKTGNCQKEIEMQEPKKEKWIEEAKMSAYSLQE